MANTLRYLKLTKEDVFKSPYPPTPGTILYSKTAQVKPIHTEIEIKEGYKRGAHRVGPGLTSTEATIETAADVNQLAFFLRHALAGYIVVGPTNTREFYTTGAFTLPSFQIGAGMDDHEARTTGVGVNTLSIGVSGGELNLAAGCIGSTYNKAAIDNSLTADDFDNLDFLTFADVDVLLDDVSISCPEVKDFTININNGMSAETAMRVGSRERCINLAGDLEVTIDFTMFRNSTKFLESFLGAADTFGPNGATTHKLEIRIIDPNAAPTDSASIIFPAVRLTTNDYTTSGNDQVDESNTFKANLGVVMADDGVTEIETLMYAKIKKEITIL